MIEPRLSLPLRLRVLNTVGKHLGAARLPVVALDEEALVQVAVKETGLTDLGSSYYREGLLRLLESLEYDAALHLSGQVAYREVIVGSLINRLLLTEACKQTPETFRKPLKLPIIFQEHASKLVPDLYVHVMQLGDNLSSYSSLQ